MAESLNYKLQNKVLSLFARKKTHKIVLCCNNKVKFSKLQKTVNIFSLNKNGHLHTLQQDLERRTHLHHLH